MTYPLTNDIKPGDALTASDLDTNFDDMFTMTDSIQTHQFRPGSVVYRTVSVAVDAYKTIQQVDQGAGTITAAGFVTADTAFDLFDGEGVLVIARARIKASGASSNCTLGITVAGASVTSRLWSFAANTIMTGTIGWYYEFVDATANHENIRLEVVSGSAFEVTSGSITVMGVNR